MRSGAYVVPCADPAPARRSRACVRVRQRLLSASLLAFVFLGVAGADEVILTNTKSLRGHARRAGAFVDLNVYHCSAPEMTHGVERLRDLDVREIRPWPMLDHLHGRLLGLAEDDLEGRRELLRLAEAFKEEILAQRLAEEILLRAPGDERALKAAGGAKSAAARLPALASQAPELRARLGRLLGLGSAFERRDAAASLGREAGFTPDAAWIERLALARRLPRGPQESLALRLALSEYEGGRYSLYVPEDLDPLRPVPLLLALHGGGIRDASGADVRGSGRDALAWFLDGAREHGFLLVCPSALEAPWTTPQNEGWIAAVLAEVCALYNVDLERVHVAGQGGGGDGAWWLAARQARTYASVGAASARRADRLLTLTGAEMGIWFFHGEDDESVPVADVRKVADSLRKRQADFVYCELPREREGFPPAARRDYWRYVAPKRRAKSRHAWPRPSLAQAPSTLYLRVLGEPAGAWGAGVGSELGTAALLERLGQGGFESEPAARRLAEPGMADPGAREQVRAWVKSERAPPATRAWGAWLLGVLKDAEASGILGDLLRAEKDLDLLLKAAAGVAALGQGESLQDLRFALQDLQARYKAVSGQAVPLHALEGACRLGAALAEALARIGAADTEILGALEEALVIGVLRDARPTVGAAPGEEESLRASLAQAIARTYRTLGARATLVDMLRVVVRRQAALKAAVETGLREGWR